MTTNLHLKMSTYAGEVVRLPPGHPEAATDRQPDLIRGTIAISCRLSWNLEAPRQFGWRRRSFQLAGVRSGCVTSGVGSGRETATKAVALRPSSRAGVIP